MSSNKKVRLPDMSLNCHECLFRIFSMLGYIINIIIKYVQKDLQMKNTKWNEDNLSLNDTNGID